MESVMQFKRPIYHAKQLNLKQKPTRLWITSNIITIDEPHREVSCSPCETCMHVSVVITIVLCPQRQYYSAINYRLGLYQLQLVL